MNERFNSRKIPRNVCNITIYYRVGCKIRVASVNPSSDGKNQSKSDVKSTKKKKKKNSWSNIVDVVLDELYLFENDNIMNKLSDRKRFTKSPWSFRRFNVHNFIIASFLWTKCKRRVNLFRKNDCSIILEHNFMLFTHNNRLTKCTCNMLSKTTQSVFTTVNLCQFLLLFRFLCLWTRFRINCWFWSLASILILAL